MATITRRARLPAVRCTARSTGTRIGRCDGSARLRRLFEKGETKGVRADHVEKLENILAVLNLAKKPEDMNLPGFRLHPLKGDLKGFSSVTVRANWRVIFRFHEGDAYDVDLIDYH